MPAAMNAANEEAVRAFIAERIQLTDIPRVIEAVMNQHSSRAADSLESVRGADRNARLATETMINEISSGSVETNAA
jgi:1-deoxy-D-xylulose-5-phosphate reductoisomerase